LENIDLTDRTADRKQHTDPPLPDVVVMLGRQGSGKGTQASLLASSTGGIHLSTGDVLRDEVDRETPIGRRVAGFLARGELVPDDVMGEVVAARLRARDRELVVLDGFPRTLAQAQLLDGLLGGGPDLVIELFVPRIAVVERLRSRRICAPCGLTTTGTAGEQCPRCGDPLTVRSDDAPEAIAQRLLAYDRETEPVLDHYAALGRLVTTDGTGPPEEVAARVADAVRAGADEAPAVA